jgi:hypothetical protein
MIAALRLLALDLEILGANEGDVVLGAVGVLGQARAEPDEAREPIKGDEPKTSGAGVEQASPGACLPILPILFKASAIRGGRSGTAGEEVGGSRSWSLRAVELRGKGEEGVASCRRPPKT